MALEAGVMSITLEYAKDLKDGDWFGKQDPYCIIRVGGQTFRTRTATDGGRNPVWNQTFQFNVINENDVELDIKDEDVGRDDHIGSATFSLAKAREAGTDRINVPVLSKKSRKQHGFIAVALSWAPNKNLRPAAAAHQPYMTMPAPYMMPPSGHHMPYMAPTPYMQPYYAAPPPSAPPAGCFPPPMQYYAAPPAAPHYPAVPMAHK
ncbi:hypothetical protein GPECTOR_5g255 [Gonium pectorale]|uniref:C2 domain-containing protein n=1 Tax=Gonium pectorale TaxID=33097 RepID=A0A150GW86_GONPE|nr:hypothetical protein GPECTOR_5g255 [Gonium pectorale]|eukprot:KXZ54157.1 hypothetical protein GPECTOR_5g255 [Gonium pectorale]